MRAVLFVVILIGLALVPAASAGEVVIKVYGPVPAGLSEPSENLLHVQWPDEVATDEPFFVTGTGASSLDAGTWGDDLFTNGTINLLGCTILSHQTSPPSSGDRTFRFGLRMGSASTCIMSGAVSFTPALLADSSVMRASAFIQNRDYADPIDVDNWPPLALDSWPGVLNASVPSGLDVDLQGVQVNATANVDSIEGDLPELQGLIWLVLFLLLLWYAKEKDNPLMAVFAMVGIVNEAIIAGGNSPTWSRYGTLLFILIAWAAAYVTAWRHAREARP